MTEVEEQAVAQGRIAAGNARTIHDWITSKSYVSSRKQQARENIERLQKEYANGSGTAGMTLTRLQGLGHDIELTPKKRKS